MWLNPRSVAAEDPPDARDGLADTEALWEWRLRLSATRPAAFKPNPGTLRPLLDPHAPHAAPQYTFIAIMEGLTVLGVSLRPD